jgi:hypothetical protein
MASVRVSMLPEYLDGVARRRFRPGELDCAIFMADWVVKMGHPDPIADVRGAYTTERQFVRMLHKEGGLIAACAARLAKIGMRETTIPSAGDLMCVAAPFAERRGKIQRRPTGAIAVSSTQWAVVTTDMGLVISSGAGLPMLMAWVF